MTKKKKAELIEEQNRYKNYMICLDVKELDTSLEYGIYTNGKAGEDKRVYLYTYKIKN